MRARNPAESYTRFSINEATGCWEWHGPVALTGYGRLALGDGRRTLAHRAFYELCVGLIPTGMQIHHSCSNRLCVNPDHLELLTAEQHVHIHFALPACGICGSTRRRQSYKPNGKKCGRSCIPCDQRRSRERARAK